MSLVPILGSEVTVYKTGDTHAGPSMFPVPPGHLFLQGQVRGDGLRPHWGHHSTGALFWTATWAAVPGKHENRTARYWTTVWLPLLVRIKFEKWRRTCEKRREVVYVILCSKKMGISLNSDTASQIAKHL